MGPFNCHFICPEIKSVQEMVNTANSDCLKDFKNIKYLFQYIYQIQTLNLVRVIILVGLMSVFLRKEKHQNMIFYQKVNIYRDAMFTYTRGEPEQVKLGQQQIVVNHYIVYFNPCYQ